MGLQTDDTLFLATTEYSILEAEELVKAQYQAKPVEKLVNSLTFNGGLITKSHNLITLTQERQCSRIQLINIKDLKASYIKERARGAYIASMSQPEAAFSLSFVAQTTSPT